MFLKPLCQQQRLKHTVEFDIQHPYTAVKNNNCYIRFIFTALPITNINLKHKYASIDKSLELQNKHDKVPDFFPF